MTDMPQGDRHDFSAAELGAIAHLYRGEVYRSTVWRQRLDTTTNWAVVTLGVALSISFAAPAASPVPLVLVGILILFFLMLEARRYRYFNVWRARARWMETHIYAPMLHDGDLHLEQGWQETLARDYMRPRYHVTMQVAIGRRIRRNYFWILLIQSLAYLGKLVVHPVPAERLSDITARAAVGPIPGWLMLTLGALYILGFCAATVLSWRDDQRRAVLRRDTTSMG